MKQDKAKPETGSFSGNSDDDASSWNSIVATSTDYDIGSSSDDSSIEENERKQSSTSSSWGFEVDEQFKSPPVDDKGIGKSKFTRSPVSRWFHTWIKYVLLLACLVVMKLSLEPGLSFDGEESIYVPGVGFSGFWFTLGRLKSIPDPKAKSYVCFSAGCLGAVAVLNEFTVDEMACLAESSQTAWKSGAISRYDVVSQFVDGLVYRNDKAGCIVSNSISPASTMLPIDNPQLLSKLHILTTERSGLLGFGAVMRSPDNLRELKEMLIQTTWIPVATGNGVTHQGHMDGGFSLWQHPKCSKNVNLPLDAGLIFNSLNVNMPKDEAYRLWNDGLAYGL